MQNHLTATYLQRSHLGEGCMERSGPIVERLQAEIIQLDLLGATGTYSREGYIWTTALASVF